MRVGDFVTNRQRTGFQKFVGSDRPKRMLVRGGERLLIAVRRFKRQVPQMNRRAMEDLKIICSAASQMPTGESLALISFQHRKIIKEA